MAEPHVPKLADLYEEIYKVYDRVENGSEASGSDEIQVEMIHGIQKAEKAITMVNELSMFSTNEEIEEVATADMRYMLLPAYLGFFTGQLCRGDRGEHVKKSQAYYKDFLRLCKNYSITDVHIPGSGEGDEEANIGSRTQAGAQDLVSQARSRHNKIEQYKQQKELEKRLNDLHTQVQKEHVDDEIKRDYYLTLIKRWVQRSLEEIENIESELKIIQYMASRKSSDSTPKDVKSKKPEKSKQAFRPFILTRDQVQAKVFGAGYPGVPTYTVEEFYKQQVASGKLPKPEDVQKQMSDAHNPEKAAEEHARQDLEKEEKIENDDPETLKKARDWDDWKDDHRRGWGNRQNMG